MPATAKVQITVEIMLGGGNFQDGDTIGRVYENAKRECLSYLENMIREHNAKNRGDRIQIVGEPKAFAILMPEKMHTPPREEV